MPYRTPSPPPLSDELNDAFWAEENTYLEARAVSAADTSIFSGLKRLASAWYKETQNRYPKDYHVIVHDLDAAARGQGEYIRIQGESRYWIEILTLALRFEGLMSVESSLFDTANQDPQVLIKEVREAAVRWVKSEPEIRKMMEGAFSSSAGKLDRELTSRFSRVTPTEVMRAVYFRGVAQRDTIAYDSFQLAQDLYFALYE